METSTELRFIVASERLEEQRTQPFTVMILSFLTDMPGQIVQTQIRLLVEKQSDQGLHCLPFRLHRLDSLLYGTNFRVITNFLGVRIFRKFTVPLVYKASMLITGMQPLLMIRIIVKKIEMKKKTHILTVRQVCLCKQCRPRSNCSWRNSLIWVYIVCHSICIFWTHYSILKPPSSNLRTTRTFWVSVFVFYSLWYIAHNTMIRVSSITNRGYCGQTKVWSNCL